MPLFVFTSGSLISLESGCKAPQHWPFHTTAVALGEIGWDPGSCKLSRIDHSIRVTNLRIIGSVVLKRMHRWLLGRKWANSGLTPAIPIAVSSHTPRLLVDISNLHSWKNIFQAGSGSDIPEPKHDFHRIFPYLCTTTNPKVIAVSLNSSIRTEMTDIQCWDDNILQAGNGGDDIVIFWFRPEEHYVPPPTKFW